MTKTQLKEKYTEWNREISKQEDRKTAVFHELQDLCEEKGDGHRWCGLERLVEELLKTGNTYKALQLFGEYHEICGKQEALRDLAIATNNFEI